jgi:hypothetical protein
MRIPKEVFRYIGIDDEGDTTASYEGEVGPFRVQDIPFSRRHLTLDLHYSILTDTNPSRKTSMDVSLPFRSKRSHEIHLRGITLTTLHVQRWPDCSNGVPYTRRIRRVQRTMQAVAFIHMICLGSRPRRRMLGGAGNRIRFERDDRLRRFRTSFVFSLAH